MMPALPAVPTLQKDGIKLTVDTKTGGKGACARGAARRAAIGRAGARLPARRV